jgi:hypothetical protein
MPITSSSLAVARGAGVQNQAFTPTAQDIPRNVVIVGTFNPSLAGGLTAETIYGPYSNAAQVGLAFGQGFMLHRLAVGVFTGAPSGGITVWCIPQAEVGGAAATSATFAITGPSTAAGTLAVYVDNIRYAISVASGDSAATIGTALTAAITADANCPCTATGTGTVSLTAKSKGPWGNSIPVAVNIQAGDATPAGVACAVTALAGGTGVPTIANALNALGTGSNANTLPTGWWMTDLVHGYLATATVMATTAQDQTTITAISTYNGLASSNPPTGCYDHNVGKPFRCINGDTTNSASVPAALISFASTNKTDDRTDALLCVPGSRTHPCEIAAVATGAINVRAGSAALRPYDGITLPGVDPGPILMWATDYTNRDTAVKAGLSPTIVVGGAVQLQNVVTFYSANTGVPQTSNGYREWVNLCKLQNIIASILSNFRGPKWQGFTIVSDVTTVTDVVAKQYVRDVNAVIDDLVALAKAWYSKGWIYSADYVIAALQAGGAVTARTAGDGFTAVLPGILSGIGNIIDVTFNFDISLAGVT